MANQIDNLVVNDDTLGLNRTVDVSSDDLFVSVDLTLQSGAIFQSDNIKRGPGNPNGSVSGNEGDLYMRTDASTGRLYINTDGTINGWEAALIPSTLVQPGVNAVVLVSGNTATAFTTITLALAASSSGDAVIVGIGTFAESFTIPAGVLLQGAWGSGVPSSLSEITGGAATGTRVTLSAGSSFENFAVTLPTDVTPAVSFAVAGEADVTNMILTGAGVSGIGIQLSGAGTLRVENVRYVTGTCDTPIHVHSSATGTLRLEHLSVAGGTVTDVLRVEAGTLQFHEINSFDTTTATDGLQVGAGTVLGNSLNLDGVVNAVHITSSSADVQVNVGRLNGSSTDLFVDPAVTAGTLHALGITASRNKFSASGTYLSEADLIIAYQDEDEGDEAFRFISEVSVGTPERGRESVFGEGDSYTAGMVVLNYTGATAATDGTFNANVSTAAASASGSTFGFPSGAVGDAIVWGSNRSNASDSLKHWGLKISQTTAMSTDGVVIWEMWDGATWAEMGVFSIESSEFYRYANEVFIRANSSEQIRYGIRPATTWALKSLNGDVLYWSRVRVTTSPTTAPVFEKSKLHTSRFEVNTDGTNEFFGTSRYRDSLSVAGNAFGEAGGITSLSLAVGSGGIPTGWTQQNKNSLLNGNGDAIMMQYRLPLGIDTSHGLTITVAYSSSAATTTDPVVIMSALPVEVSGVLVADPAGAVVPTARTVANTETVTSKIAQTHTISTVPSTPDKLHQLEFGPFDITDYYEGDLVLVRFELDSDGNPNSDIGVFTMELNGIKWTPGGRF